MGISKVMDESVIDFMSDRSCFKSLILVGSFSQYCQCVYVIMSVCHYVIMLVLSSAHYGQCVCHYVSVIMSLC